MPPRRRARTVPVVVVPGWQGSGEGHWQTWLEDELRAGGRQTVRPGFADLDHPQLDDWLGALRTTLRSFEPGYDVVAHSLGAVLWLHHAALDQMADPGDVPLPARVLLTSPPSPSTAIDEIASFLPPPLSVEAVRAAADGTVLVAGDDDPFLPEGIAEAYGRPLKIATTVVPGGAHLNPAAGFGPWPAVLDWCGRDNLAFF